MIFNRSDHCFFELKIRGYQFPDIIGDQYDSNWLMVQINMRHPLGEWSSVDPSLLTSEVENLIYWLEAIHAGDCSNPDLWFIEPCMEFHLIESCGAPRSIRVVFSHEYSPPWAGKGLAEGDEHFLEFPLSDVDLKAAIASLHEDLARFPARARS